MIEQFHRPNTITEALRLKGRFKGRAIFLAGGTYLNSTANPPGAEHLISLGGLKLDRIEKVQAGVTIGALCTLQQLLDDRKVPEALKEALSKIASRNIRNMATIGGHIAANEPRSDLLPMLIALEAAVRVSGARTTTTVSVLDYIKAPKNRLITKIVIPPASRGRGAACCNIRDSANARSILTAAASATPGRTGIKDPILALGGLAHGVVRLTSIERIVDGKPMPALDELERIIARSIDPASTPFEGGAFRKYQAGVVMARALHDALRRRGGRA